MVEDMNTHQAKVQCFNVKCKFLFIFITIAIIVTEIY